MKVYELARSLDIPSRDIIEAAPGLGINRKLTAAVKLSGGELLAFGNWRKPEEIEVTPIDPVEDEAPKLVTSEEYNAATETSVTEGKLTLAQMVAQKSKINLKETITPEEKARRRADLVKLHSEWKAQVLAARKAGFLSASQAEDMIDNGDADNPDSGRLHLEAQLTMLDALKLRRSEKAINAKLLRQRKAEDKQERRLRKSWDTLRENREELAGETGLLAVFLALDIRERNRFDTLFVFTGVQLNDDGISWGDGNFSEARQVNVKDDQKDQLWIGDLLPELQVQCFAQGMELEESSLAKLDEIKAAAFEPWETCIGLLQSLQVIVKHVKGVILEGDKVPHEDRPQAAHDWITSELYGANRRREPFGTYSEDNETIVGSEGVGSQGVTV